MESVSFFELLQLDGNVVAFNSPPEILKRLNKEGLPNPNVIVIGDTATYNDTPLVNTEFPVLYQMFIGGGFDFPTMSMTRPIYLVGERSRVDAHLKALRMAVTGPTHKEYKSLGVKDPLRSMLLRESHYFALKRGDAIIPIEEFCRPVYFEDFSETAGIAEIEDIGLEILHVGKDRFLASNGKKQKKVQLSSEGVLEPTWDIPVLKAVETSHEFRMFVLGADSGFGPNSTTGYLFEVHGEYVMWDCPAYVSHTLRANGIKPGQIGKIFISHVHDDHANDLLPFALNSVRKVEIYGTREVLFSLKAKLAAIWHMSEKRLEHYFRWRVVSTKRSVNIYGYRFDTHYGVHPIPSIGVTLSHHRKHVLTVTGDTGLHDVLQKAMEAQAISPERYKQVLKLLDRGLCFADAGEASIHGMLTDLEKYDAPKLMTYHRTGIPEDLVQQINLIKPGNAYAVKATDPRLLDASLIATVLQRLGIREHESWAKTLCLESEVQVHEAQHILVQKDSQDVEYMYIIAHGIVDVVIDGTVVASLSKGDFFGEQAVLDEKQVKARNASIVSRSPLRLIAIPGNLLMDMIREDKLLSAESGNGVESAYSRLQRVWRNRAVISGVKEFQRLRSYWQNELSVQVETREFAPGDLIVAKGSTLKEAYVVARGSVEVILNKPRVKNPILRQHSLFGENVALGLSDRRNANVVANEHCVVFVLKGADIKRFFEEIPAMRYELEETAKERGIDIDKAAEAA